MSEAIVVIRPGALGDTILSMDALWMLRAAYPAARLELVGNRAAGELLQKAHVVNLVTGFDDAVVLSLFHDPPVLPRRWGNASVALICLPDPAPVAAAFRAAGVTHVATAAPAAIASDEHMADYQVRCLREAGIPAAATRLGPLQLPGPDMVRLAPRIVVHPGSGSPRKNWPAAAFAEVIRTLMEGHQGEVVLLGGPADGESLAAVRLALSDLAVPVVRPATLLELVATLQGAMLHVGNDSGVTHLSARLGVPTLAIFGATSPGRWAPRGPCVCVLGEDGAWPAVVDVLEEISRCLMR